MTLRLRDTLTREVRPIEPLEPGRVRMYTCGPTVYRYAHVGNLRSYLLADLIRRVLLYHGVDVFHVKNITDVGHLRDDAVRSRRGPDARPGRPRAQVDGRDRGRLRGAFHADEALVNILPAHVFPRATEHIPEMLDLAERLEDAGHAYAPTTTTSTTRSGRSRTTAKLSGNSLDDLRAGPTAARSSTTSATRPTSRCGSPPGPARAEVAVALGRGLPGLAPRVLGDGAANTSASGSTSTPAASTTSSRTTRTRSRSRSRSSAARPPPSGCTASTC